MSVLNEVGCFSKNIPEHYIIWVKLASDTSFFIEKKRDLDRCLLVLNFKSTTQFMFIGANGHSDSEIVQYTESVFNNLSSRCDLQNPNSLFMTITEIVWQIKNGIES